MTMTVVARPGARSWESPRMWQGPGFPFLSDSAGGYGFMAFASDWPEGTRLEVTARILPPEGTVAAPADDLERLQQAIRGPVVWLAGLACGMRKVWGADGDDWTLWADNIEKAASELAALLPENQDVAAPAAGEGKGNA